LENLSRFSPLPGSSKGTDPSAKGRAGQRLSPDLIATGLNAGRRGERERGNRNLMASSSSLKRGESKSRKKTTQNVSDEIMPGLVKISPEIFSRVDRSKHAEAIGCVVSCKGETLSAKGRADELRSTLEDSEATESEKVRSSTSVSDERTGGIGKNRCHASMPPLVSSSVIDREEYEESHRRSNSSALRDPSHRSSGTDLSAFGRAGRLLPDLEPLKGDVRKEMPGLVGATRICNALPSGGYDDKREKFEKNYDLRNSREATGKTARVNGDIDRAGKRSVRGDRDFEGIPPLVAITKGNIACGWQDDDVDDSDEDTSSSSGEQVQAGRLMVVV